MTEENYEMLKKSNLGKTIKALDIYRKIELDVLVDEAKIYEFNNKKKVITMTAPEPDHKYWVTFEVPGTIDDLETKLGVWNNPVKSAYGRLMNFNADVNDPEREIWNKVLNHVKNNPEKYFTKSGDWRRRIQANMERGVLEEVENN